MHADRRPRHPLLAWAGYAASAWAIAYAIGVRGYQGLGGTVGLAGTFEDPAAMRRASLIAGAGILLVGIGSLALVRPWGLRFPRLVVIVPALSGSAYAAAHALTAYITKPLDAAGVVHLRFDGWARARRDARSSCGTCCSTSRGSSGSACSSRLGTVHHHRRTGGSARGGAPARGRRRGRDARPDRAGLRDRGRARLMSTMGREMDEFEAHRTHLHAVATRILGSRAEADDALQEAWIRLDRTDTSEVDNLGGWLTTVVSRVCLTMLDARKRRREEALEEGRLPDPVITRADDAAPDPEAEALAADAVGAALLVVLETLQPAERLAFVLHDLFAVPFEDIAPIVDRSPAAARQLASRARRRVQGADRHAPTADRQVVEAFLAASRDGDFEGLLAVLDPDVVVRVDDGGGALRIVQGARAVATRARSFSGKRIAHPAIVDGAAGFVATEDGVPVAVLAFTVVDGRITSVDALDGAARLAGLGLEALVAG